jgi:hypothetical protein
MANFLRLRHSLIAEWVPHKTCKGGLFGKLFFMSQR